MKNWTSVRAVYLLISTLLAISIWVQNWYLVGFVTVMLQIGTWFQFCPSKWVFEKLGLKKSEL